MIAKQFTPSSISYIGNILKLQSSWKVWVYSNTIIFLPCMEQMRQGTTQAYGNGRKRD